MMEMEKENRNPGQPAEASANACRRVESGVDDNPVVPRLWHSSKLGRDGGAHGSSLL